MECSANPQDLRLLLLKLQGRRNDTAMAALLCCRTIRSGWLEHFTALGTALFSVAIYAPVLVVESVLVRVHSCETLTRSPSL